MGAYILHQMRVRSPDSISALLSATPRPAACCAMLHHICLVLQHSCTMLQHVVLRCDTSYCASSDHSTDRVPLCCTVLHDGALCCSMDSISEFVFATPRPAPRAAKREGTAPPPPVNHDLATIRVEFR